ncbi:MAG: SIR2 family protein, partial [Deltaproteobacteria bacterium]|nr:SIR2 family protein [Deltaproteobacteria bacterium]
MVGSGFSRNAEMKAPGAETPPDWADVANAMRGELKPAAADTGGDGVDGSGLDALGTAQRYSDEFGRVALHGFLRDQIRDEDMEPGDLHRRLLKLPWVDVFTTNWDTLLERTRELTVSPTYEVVRAVDELPLASRPRIVKLHGSLPAHFPLIATEQDYGEYPKRFAAFVNTARQALM